MRIEWNARTIGWFQRASAHTGFHEQLAGIIAPFLSAEEDLCDMGCGAGLIDLVLSRNVRHVTCVDRDEVALAALAEQAKAQNIENLAVRQGDVHRLTGRWDTGLMVFFGQVGEHVHQYLSLCNHNLIAVVRKQGCPLLPGEQGGSPEGSGALTALTENRIRFMMVESALEYGQPLRDMEEARCFAEFYGKVPKGQSTGEYLRANLVESGSSKFPLYLPGKKSMEIYIIPRASNEHLLGRERGHTAG